MLWSAPASSLIIFVKYPQNFSKKKDQSTTSEAINKRTSLGISKICDSSLLGHAHRRRLHFPGLRLEIQQVGETLHAAGRGIEGLTIDKGRTVGISTARHRSIFGLIDRRSLSFPRLRPTMQQIGETWHVAGSRAKINVSID